jgi:Flp pilus assembly pilin Flp
LRRRRGAGATEYVVLTGLIAILLVGAVGRFGHEIQVTFIGSTGSKVEATTRSAASSQPRSGKGSDGRWHSTDAAGKRLSAPDVEGAPGRWTYD